MEERELLKILERLGVSILRRVGLVVERFRARRLAYGYVFVAGKARFSLWIKKGCYYRKFGGYYDGRSFGNLYRLFFF